MAVLVGLHSVDFSSNSRSVVDGPPNDSRQIYQSTMDRLSADIDQESDRAIDRYIGRHYRRLDPPPIYMLFITGPPAVRILDCVPKCPTR